MPELPEVEAVCRRLRGAVLGARIAQLRVTRPSIVRPQSPATLESSAPGLTILAVERRGKHILIRLSSDQILHVHLRMTGNLTVIPDARFRNTSARLFIELEDGRAILYEDPRALGKVHLITAADLPAILANVGLEPLSPEFTLDYLRLAAARSKKPVKLFLMDQNCVAGLGNIYAAEALFRARIHPTRIVSKLSRPRLAQLHLHIRQVMTEALASASAAYAHAGEFVTEEWFTCAVYGRESEPCPTCSRPIKRIPQGGRSTYYCPHCQR